MSVGSDAYAFPFDSCCSSTEGPLLSTASLLRPGFGALPSSWRPSLGAFYKKTRSDKYSLRNRLLSIEFDSSFVRQTVAQIRDDLPEIEWNVYANKRCGLWYVPPSVLESDTCYFKSGDGHYGHWSFHLRRLNAHILSELCSANRGAIIVDSTTAGKRFPDALGRTVPIWCHVLNTYFFERYQSTRQKFSDCKSEDSSKCEMAEPSTVDSTADEMEMKYTPLMESPAFVTCANVMHDSEKQQLASEKLPEFVDCIWQSADAVNSHLTDEMAAHFAHCPLRPFWIDPVSVNGLGTHRTNVSDDSGDRVLPLSVAQLATAVLKIKTEGRKCTPLILMSASNQKAFAERKRTPPMTHCLSDSVLVSSECGMDALAISETSLMRVPFSYIQGSGDDCEHWCKLQATASGIRTADKCQLTPALFWQNHEAILQLLTDASVVSADDEQLQRAICKLVTHRKAAATKCFDGVVTDGALDDAKRDGADIAEESPLFVFDRQMSGCLNPDVCCVSAQRLLDERCLTSDSVKQSLSERCKEDATDLVVLCTEHIQDIEQLQQFYRTEDGGSAVNCKFVAVHLTDSKKCKHSLYSALTTVTPLIDACFEADGDTADGSILDSVKMTASKCRLQIVGDCSSEALLCLSAAFVLYLISRHCPSAFDLKLWFADATELGIGTDLKRIEIKKKDIQFVVSRVSVEVTGFHPPRLLLKQINRFFMS